MTPVALGFGGPDSDGRVVGRGVVALSVGDGLVAAADGVPAVGALDVGVLAGARAVGWEQPASPPIAAPADPSSIVRREIMLRLSSDGQPSPAGQVTGRAEEQIADRMTPVEHG